MAFTVGLLLYDEFLSIFRTCKYTGSAHMEKKRCVQVGTPKMVWILHMHGESHLDFKIHAFTFFCSQRRRCKLGPLRHQYCLQIGKDAFSLRIQMHTCRCIRPVRRLMFNENIWGGFSGVSGGLRGFKSASCLSPSPLGQQWNTAWNCWLLLPDEAFRRIKSRLSAALHNDVSVMFSCDAHAIIIPSDLIAAV